MPKLKLSKALSPFKRNPTVEVHCGDDFYVTIRQTAIYSQEYRSRATQWLENYNRTRRDQGGGKGLSVAGVSTESITGTGDRAVDIRYFVEVLLVSWRGLKDDDGRDVPCDRANAVELFSQGEEGWTLMQLLVQHSTNDANFTAADADEAVALGKE